MEVWLWIKVIVICVIYDVDEVILFVDCVVMMINGLQVIIGKIIEVDLLCFCMCKVLFEYLDYYVYCQEVFDFLEEYEYGKQGKLIVFKKVIVVE